MSPVLRLTYLVILVVLCASAAYSNPVVGSEVRICPVYNPAPGNHEGVQIAASPYGYFAVWKDSRGGEADVFGCRISPTGEVLDPAGIPISQSDSEQLDPTVAWNGTDYLVVWSDRRTGLQHIYCTRVRPSGEVIDPQGVCISGTTGTQAYPRVASDKAGFQVVWQDSRGGSQDIYGCRVSGDGSLGRVMGIVTLAGNNEELPDIAYNGTSFLVVWRDQRNSATTAADIYGCRVAKNGLRMGSDILISCDSTGTSGVTGSQSAPRVSICGTSDCMVVWEDSRNVSGNGDIYGARVSSSGVVTDKNGRPIATGTAIQEIPSIGFDGTRLLVVWRDRTYRFVRGARMSTSGTVLDPGGFNISLYAAGSVGTSVCPASGSGFWVGWNSLSIVGNDAMTGKVPGTGSFSGTAGTLLSTRIEDQSSYSVADNGSEYAVVWSQDVAGNRCIMGARVSHSGEVLTPTAVNITDGVYGQQTQPSIAWNGSEYLVVWCGNESYESSNLDIRGLRLTSSLQSKDVNGPLTICAVTEAQTNPSVASNGNKFLVAWEDSRNSISPTYYTDVYGALVDTNGGVTAISSAINQSVGDQRKPKIASNGTDFYVVWEDYRTGSPLAYGVRVTSSGSIGSSLGTAMPATSSYQVDPRVCFGGGYYFVTWSDWTRITGCRVSTTGSVVDAAGMIIDSGLTTKSSPAGCWDGSQYQVVWEDYRSAFAGNSDVYYTTAGPTGVVSSDPKSALVTDLSPQLTPRIFGDTSSGALFYSRYEAYSNGLCCCPLTQQGVQEVPTISAAKQMPAGSLVVLRGKVVTVALPGYFYAEEADRSSGIRVLSPVTVHTGDVVDVTGVLSTCDGERQITTGSVIAMGVAGSPTMPFGVRGDMLGGVALGTVVPGITGAHGANNIGLLVKTWGKVTSVGSGYFYIESKPGTAIKVKSGSLLPPAVGKLVSVLGVSTTDVGYGSINRAILPCQQSDIVVLH